jgi:type IV pilus assembly protein PilV
MSHPRRSSAAMGGFSLIEIMVAVVVICVGLLGIAKMQALSISNTTESRLRSLASFEAASLASAMHADRAYWSQTPSKTTTITTNPLTITATDATLQGDVTTDLASAPNINTCVGTASATAACSGNNGADMAGFDLARWAYSLSTLLPSASAKIVCNTLTPPTSCRIRISWEEQAVASNNTETNVSGVGVQNINNPTYNLYVEP